MSGLKTGHGNYLVDPSQVEVLRVFGFGVQSLQTGACRVVPRRRPNQEVKTLLQQVAVGPS